jgi:hypothetical protein
MRQYWYICSLSNITYATWSQTLSVRLKCLPLVSLMQPPAMSRLPWQIGYAGRCICKYTVGSNFNKALKYKTANYQTIIRMGLSCWGQGGCFFVLFFSFIMHFFKVLFLFCADWLVCSVVRKGVRRCGAHLFSLVLTVRNQCLGNHRTVGFSLFPWHPHRRYRRRQREWQHLCRHWILAHHSLTTGTRNCHAPAMALYSKWRKDKRQLCVYEGQ